MVLGIPGMLAPWLGDGTALKVGQESVLFLQLPYYVATVLLFLVVMLDKTLTRTEGWVLFLAYLLFVGKLFHLI
jgi:Ca2+/Na+ antiporter